MLMKIEEWIERHSGLLWILIEFAFIVGLIWWITHHGDLHS